MGWRRTTTLSTAVPLQQVPTAATWVPVHPRNSQSRVARRRVVLSGRNPCVNSFLLDDGALLVFFLVRCSFRLQDCAFIDPSLHSLKTTKSCGTPTPQNRK